MKDKIYLDTNTLVYLYSDDKKSKTVEKLMNKDLSNIIISTQILNELINVLTYKLKIKTKPEIKEIINDLIADFYISQINNNTIIQAIDITIKYKYHYFDSLIIASALQNNCTILYTEDMQHNQIIEDTLKIVNPFK